MKMMSISMITSDAQGTVVFKEGTSTFGEQPARVSRQATLDGGAVIVHSGVSHGDRTFKINTKINAEQKALIEHIHQNSTLVLISCTEGLFLGAISTINTNNGTLTATILIKSKEV